MGYRTTFNGELLLSRNLTVAQFNFINKLGSTRRVKRDVSRLMEICKGKDGYPYTTVEGNTPEEIYGVEGEFYVGNENYTSITHNNDTPSEQPSLYGDFVVEEHGENQVLVLNECGYAGDAIKWVKYLIKNLFEPWSITLNGDIEWEGSERGDLGLIEVSNNVVEISDGEITYKKK